MYSWLLSLIPAFNPSTSIIGSTFKVYPDCDHFPCHYSCSSQWFSLLTHLSLLLPLLVSCHEFILIMSIIKDLATLLVKAFHLAQSQTSNLYSDLQDWSDLNPWSLGPHLLTHPLNMSVQPHWLVCCCLRETSSCLKAFALSDPSAWNTFPLVNHFL